MKTNKRNFLLIFSVGVLMLLFATSALAGNETEHPCHPGGTGGPGGPGGPGSPPVNCPPTPVPGEALDPSSLYSAPPVSFLVTNKTDQNITLWLGSPVLYVFNIGPNTSKTFTVSRNVYPYSLRSCGQESTGYMDVTIQTFFQVEPCYSNEHLVRVNVLNDSSWSMEVLMDGTRDFVFYLDPGQTRSLTIPRGDYTVKYMGCIPEAQAFGFTARANSSLSLICP